VGVRALPAAASQVTPSQAIAMFDDEEIIPETEMLSNDNAISNTSNDISAAHVEATQPPKLTQTEVRNLILAPNVSTNQRVTPSLGSRLEKDPGVASGGEGTDDLTIPSQLIEEFSATKRVSLGVREFAGSEEVSADVRDIAPTSAPVLAVTSKLASAVQYCFSRY